MLRYTLLEDFVIDIYCLYKLERVSKYSLQNLADILEIDLVMDSPKNHIVQDIIFIESGSKEEQREAFVHELGHYFRHAGKQRKSSISFRNLTEWQADQFAYHFCIPTFFLFEDDLPFCREEATKIIMKKYGVTYAFASKRLDMYEHKLLDVYGKERAVE